MIESELERSRRVNARPSDKKPLSDLDVIRISEQCDLNHVLGIIDFARAIEERHGIK